MENYLENYILENKEKFYRLAFSYVRNKDDALDIVSESILKAFKNQPNLKDQTSIKTWFYRIIVNTALDFLRKNKKIVAISEEDLENENGIEDTYTDMDLHDALNHLPDQYRTIIILRFFEDMKIEEIAIILKENANTIKTRLYKGLKKLRLELEEDSAVQLGGRSS